MKNQKQKAKTHPSANFVPSPEGLRQILSQIAGAIDLEFFKEIIGQTNALHLLIYLAGLIISPQNVTLTALAQLLKLCRHDALRRMLAGMKLPVKTLSRLFTRWIKANRKRRGWLILDDTLINKEYSRLIEFAGYAWLNSQKRRVMGIHTVALYWTDGLVRIPVGHRVWIPKARAREMGQAYRTKVDLAIELLTHNENFVKTCEYIAFDSWYCSKKILRICALLGLPLVSRLKKNRKVVFKGRETTVSSLPAGLSLVELPQLGRVLVYRDNSLRDPRWFIGSDIFTSGNEVKRRYESRWAIEECFRFMKQKLGLEGCQCRKNTAAQNHISLAFLAHFAMEVISGRKENPYHTSMIFEEKFHGWSPKIPNLRNRRTFLKFVA